MPDVIQMPGVGKKSSEQGKKIGSATARMINGLLHNMDTLHTHPNPNSCRNGQRKNDAPTPQRNKAKRSTHTNNNPNTNCNLNMCNIRSNHGDYE
jgi:hypothetical protein